MPNLNPVRTELTVFEAYEILAEYGKPALLPHYGYIQLCDQFRLYGVKTKDSHSLHCVGIPIK